VTGTVPAGSQSAFAVSSSPRLIISLYNITTDLEKTGCKVVDWIHLGQVRDRW
jgi:hypothetical protein